VAERFGRYAGKAADKLIWLHAVSVGEARAAAPLVKALRAAFADHAVLLTCTTAAGRDTLRQLHGAEALIGFLPYDLPGAVRRFLEHWRPRVGVLMETEVWPNLLAGCAAQSIPVVLANARMSEKSARGYARWPGLARQMFSSLAQVCAQSAADAERLRALGARAIEVTGNLKFDVDPDPAQLAAGRAWRERSREQVPGPGTRIYLGDTMGEMAFYFAACDVAVIGGSFLPLGGQNLIEALACGAPVVTGPSMFNFAEATRLALEARAAIQAPDAGAALAEALRLLKDRARRAEMAAAGKQLCEQHRGATGRHLAVCRRLLSARG
jgi:3-deoxy-D-manno-octulosonic-acid transferase